MNAQDFEKQIKSYVARMPQLPPTVGKVLAICNDPMSSPAELNRAIGMDPVLTAKVLKLINSAYYGMVQEITSLVRAVVLLGMNTVKNLALSSAIISELGTRRRFGNLHPVDFWRHCLGVGAVCRMIARARGVSLSEMEEFFIVGLLHDLGKIPLNSCFAEEYGQIVAAGDDGQDEPLFIKEETRFGMDHAAVGRMILEHWNLRPKVALAVGGHHDPGPVTGQHGDYINTVAAADDFVNLCHIGFSGERTIEELRPTVYSALGLDLEFFDQHKEVLLDEIAQAMVFLEVA